MSTPKQTFISDCDLCDSDEIIERIRDLYQTISPTPDKIAAFINDEYALKNIELHIGRDKVATHIKMLRKDGELTNREIRRYAARVYGAALKLSKDQKSFTSDDIYIFLERTACRGNPRIPRRVEIYKHLEEVEWAVRLEDQQHSLYSYISYKLRSML